MATLQHKTLESPLKEIQALPVSWFVKRLKDQTLYMLDMKNCDVINISAQVALPFMPDSIASANISEEQQRKSGYSNEVLQDPGLILKIDLSLNGIREVAVDDIAVFPELRSLDLSLNAIQKFQGIGVATKLVYLNVSYNNISQIPNEALAQCINLQHLDLSVNKITTLSGFPNLPNVTKLSVRNNKLRDLQGVHVLRSLRQLTELKLQNNKISNVPDTVSAISPLSHLKQLFIKGNPLSETHTDIELQSHFAKDTSVELLDGVNIRPAKIQFKNLNHLQPPTSRDRLKVELKDAVKESMAEAMAKNRKETQERLSFLHKKILTLLDELEESEVTSLSDTEAWCRYIDTLTMEEARSLTLSQIRAAAIAEPDGYLHSKVAMDDFSTHTTTKRNR